jgi:hypothetical protein
MQQSKALRLITGAPFFVRNESLHNDLGLERLEVFFRNATSDSYELVMGIQTTSRLKNLQKDTGKSHALAMRFEHTITILLYLFQNDYVSSLYPYWRSYSNESSTWFVRPILN